MDEEPHPPGLGPYDDAVPHPPPDPALAARFADLRARAGAGGLPADPARLEQVRDLVVVVSASRGGSTLLAELLRACPGLVSLPGELNPYVTIAQLAGGDRDVLAAEVARDLGAPAACLDADGLPGFVLDCAWRLAVAWPAVEIGVEQVERWVHAVLHPVVGDRGTPGRAVTLGSGAGFTARLLALARAEQPALDPGRYDLGDAPDAPLGPPGEVVVEMPPFRLLRPWRRASTADLRDRPVVLATPRNSWRLPLLRGLFPGARLRVLHLVRNPAASVNGLMDGWEHPGFFNAPAPGGLDIAGYSDRFPEWGRRWWKFDFPPDWESVRTARLPAVAALQWSSAHERALEEAASGSPEVHRVAYEDLVGPPARRVAVTERLADWLGVPTSALVPGARRGLPPVMATVPPAPGRWRAREHEIAPVLGRLVPLARELGYPPEVERWT